MRAQEVGVKIERDVGGVKVAAVEFGEAAGVVETVEVERRAVEGAKFQVAEAVKGEHAQHAREAEQEREREGEVSGGCAGVEGKHAADESTEPPAAIGRGEVAQGTPRGPEGEHRAAEDGLVVNVDAAREEKQGAAECGVGEEEHDAGGRRQGVGAAGEPHDVNGELQQQKDAAPANEADIEHHEREAEERGRRAEVAVEF
eukprot:gene37414-50493_t